MLAFVNYSLAKPDGPSAQIAPSVQPDVGQVDALRPYTPFHPILARRS